MLDLDVDSMNILKHKRETQTIRVAIDSNETCN